jgi:hypothetical protein
MNGAMYCHVARERARREAAIDLPQHEEMRRHHEEHGIEECGEPAAREQPERRDNVEDRVGVQRRIAHTDTRAEPLCPRADVGKRDHVVLLYGLVFPDGLHVIHQESPGGVGATAAP